MKELLERLNKLDSDKLRLIIHALLLSKKLDYVTLSNEYVKTLSESDDDKAQLLAEANACLFEQCLPDTNEQSHNNRCLRHLDKHSNFKVDNLKEKYNYDNEEAESLSYYYKFAKHF